MPLGSVFVNGRPIAEGEREWWLDNESAVGGFADPFDPLINEPADKSPA